MEELSSKSKKLYSLYKDGNSLKVIAEKYSVSRGVITRIFQKNNLKIRNRSNSQKIIYPSKTQKKIREMVSHSTLTEISKKLKIGKVGLKTYLIDNKLRKFRKINTQGPPKVLLKKIEENLKNHYYDLINTPKTLKEKSTELKVSANILRTRFTDAGYKLRTLAEEHLVYQKIKNPNLNYNFFKKRSPESDYWIGFIGADGTIIDLSKDTNKKLRLAISLGEKDKRHLYKIKKLLRGGSVTKFDYSRYNNKYKSKKIKRYIKHGLVYKYQLDNTLICRDLVKFGVTPRKTFTFKPHKVLENSKDFWRGIIDGDGSLTTLDKTRSTNLQFASGSKNEFKSYIKFLKKKNIKRPLVQIRKSKYSKPFYVVSITGVRARKIAKLLYEKSSKTARLDRKYKIYLQWKKRRNI